MTPEEEHKKHIENILAFEKQVSSLFPAITCHAFIMSLDGTIERLNWEDMKEDLYNIDMHF